MAYVSPPVVTFQGGIIGGELHNRVDIQTYPQGAEVMQNFRPTLQGVQMRRPPMIHVDAFEDHSVEGELFPFVYSVDESYLVLATATGFKFYANDGLITIPTVTPTVPSIGSGAFTDRADSATITASSSNGGQTPNLLVDEDGTTYWQSMTAGTEWLRFDMGAATTLRSLSMTALASYGGYMPTSFTVQGSTTGSFSGEEVTLHTVSGASPFNSGERRVYRFTNPGSYRYYRVRMTANSAGSSYIIAELSLFDSPWVDVSTEAGAVSIAGTKIWLDSDGASRAILEGQIAIAVGDTAKQHVISFEVGHGPVDIRIGTTSGDDSVLAYTRLRAGHHLLAFTPGATTVFVQFRNAQNAGRWIKNTITILPGPHFELSCPFTDTDLPEVHTQQIRDVLYMVHQDYWTRRLERRGSRSWSIVKLLPDNGPFGDINTTDISIAASATNGEVTLTASDELFTANDEGVLFALTGTGQTASATATSDDVETGAIKITGVGSAARSFTYSISGTFAGTVTLERSSGNTNNFVPYASYTTAGAFSFYDALDNQTWYYRLKVRPGAYTSGTIIMQLSSPGGSSEGIVRVLEVTDAFTAIAEVMTGYELASTTATSSWKRGDWNASDGFPAAITDGFGRLWLARGDKVWASRSDNFTNFESVIDEDDSSFSRNMATPSSDAVRWIAKLNHLVIGTASLEQIGLGNTTSEPIGPQNFQFLPGSEEGGAQIQPIEAGGSVLFVHRNRRQLMQFTQNPKALSETSYISVDLTARAPEILDSRIVDVAVQREPERRIFVVLESGKLCELLFRREGELDVVAWSTIETQGRVERCVVMPREDEDIVYFIVRRRNAAGAWERFIERFGNERVLMDCDRYHLDSCLGYELIKPNTVATPSGRAGTITVTVDDPAFSSGDVGDTLWINGGRGTITAFGDVYTVTLNVTSELSSDEPCPPGRWGHREKTSTLAGLDHLNGLSVRVWGDMMDLGTATVAAGSITLPQQVSVAYVGLPHRSRWKSLKLAYGAQKGTAIGMFKGLKGLIVLLYKTSASLTYGKGIGPGLRRSFQPGEMYSISTRTADVPMGEPIPLYTGEKDLAFDAHYSPDLRLCFEIDGPGPAVLAGYVPLLDTRER